MNTLQITKQNAITAYTNTDTAGKILLQSLFGKEIFQKTNISSFDEALALSGRALPDLSGLSISESAYVKLRLIIDLLNGDWVADWTNKNQPKYMIWWNMEPFSLSDVGGYCRFSFVPSRLCFRDRKTAEYFLSIPEFVDLYKTYMLD